jgi:hemoglobin
MLITLQRSAAVRVVDIAYPIVSVLIVLGASMRGTVPTAGLQGKPASLYERLGGTYAIATVVDDFIERLLVNDTLNANPAIREARARAPKAGLKFHVTALVCDATGGPCKYSGRTMAQAHEHLNITQIEWDAMVSDFKATLRKFGVRPQEEQELMAIVDSTKRDIVRPYPPVKR